ncbi:MAG: serA 2 [Rickettsiales bacterium]|jgi:D-3-phosphoglycerate dehydrogenase|nr:serA 2 [Rickettsiales bacterium]
MTSVLIAESLHEPTLRAWQEKNPHYTINYQPDISISEIESALVSYEALIIRPKQVTAKAIEQAKSLRLIIRGGAGVNSIALEMAKTNNVVVENTPGQNSVSTAEYTFGLIYELVAQRKTVFAHVDVMESDEEELLALLPMQYAGYELADKRLAVIGLGAIGQAVAARAKAFEMDVVAYSASFRDRIEDPRVKALGIRQANTLDEAIGTADIISLHVPLTPQTQGMVNAEFIAKIKDGAVIIDTARPQLIDPIAFEDGLKTGKVGGLGMDGDPDLILPFVRLAKEYSHVPMLLSHHIADATEEAQIKITRQCLLQLEAFFKRGETINRVA